MDSEKNIKDIDFNAPPVDSGHLLPDGYMESFAQRMKDMLPETDFERGYQPETDIKRSFWERVRPYAYMAAMFAGVWLMMNMFSLFTPTADKTLFNDNPNLIAALDNDSFMNDYFIDDVDDYEFYNDLYESGFEPASVIIENL